MAGGFSRCQFCMFDSRVADGVENTSFEPYQRSSASFTFDSVNDKERIQGLRQYRAQGSAAKTPSPTTLQIPITRITMLKNYDLHVKVLDVVREKGKVTLVVWDGSDARPFVPGMNLNGSSPGDGNTCHYWMPCGQDFAGGGHVRGEEKPRGSEPRFRCC